MIYNCYKLMAPSEESYINFLTLPLGPVSPSLQAVTVVELTVDKDEGNVNAVLTFPVCIKS